MTLLLCACNAGPPVISSLRDAGPPKEDPKQPTGLGGSSGGAPDAWPGFGGFPDSSPVEVSSGEKVLVYAHSGSDLFSVDPQTKQFSRVGNFAIRSMTPVRFLNDVTDIAVDRNGRIVGTTFRSVLQIDPTTADCMPVSSLPPGRSFNGLSWVRLDSGEEQLMATTLDGGVFRIDPATGAADQVGSLGGGQRSSGDLVSVQGYGTLVTLQGTGTDRLARVDPATGAATVIGDVGFQKVWGLGFWGNQVFGFTQTGQFILINPMTGKGELVESMPAFPFWGAGVTTSVPVIL